MKSEKNTLTTNYPGEMYKLEVANAITTIQAYKGKGKGKKSTKAPPVTVNMCKRNLEGIKCKF